MNLSNSPGHKAQQRAGQLAHATIRSLLNGSSPAALTQPSTGAYGRWGATVERLFSAHAAGGTPAVEELYQELHRADSHLITLMGSGGLLAIPEIISIADLLSITVEPLQYLVDQLIPPGFTSGSGRPKVGKSILYLQVALAVSTGGQVLGFQARQARVLYLALEDSLARLQDRLHKMGASPNANLDFALAWSPFSEDGLDRLDEQIAAKGYGLVVIDTFSRINGRADQMDPNEMTQIYAALQQMAIRHNAAIIMVDHHRKTARNAVDNDPIDDIFGSTAKAGVLDCAMGLYRKHNSNDAVLKLVGRDFGDAEYALTWDPEHFTWQRKDEPKPPAKEARPTTILDRVHVNEIVEAIDALGSCTLARLAAAVQIDKSNLFDLLKALVDAGILRRNTDNHIVTYSLAQPSAAATQPPLLPGDPPMDTTRYHAYHGYHAHHGRFYAVPGQQAAPLGHSSAPQSPQAPKTAQTQKTLTVPGAASFTLLHLEPSRQRLARDSPPLHQFKKGHHDHRLAGPHRPRHPAAPRRVHARWRTRRPLFALPPGRIPDDRHRPPACLAPPGTLGVSWPPRRPQRLRPPRRRHRLPAPPRRHRLSRSLRAAGR